MSSQYSGKQEKTQKLLEVGSKSNRYSQVGSVNLVQMRQLPTNLQLASKAEIHQIN